MMSRVRPGLFSAVAAAVLATAGVAGASTVQTIGEETFTGGFDNAGWETLGTAGVIGNELVLGDSRFTPDGAAGNSSISTTGFTDVTLHFSWEASGNTEGSGSAEDNFYVWWSIGEPTSLDPSEWTQIFTASGGSNVGGTESIDLGPVADDASQLSILFWANVTGSAETFSVDDVVLKGTAIAPDIAPVPLPASALLLLAGLGGLAAFRRKKA